MTDDAAEYTEDLDWVEAVREYRKENITLPQTTQVTHDLYVFDESGPMTLHREVFERDG